MGEHKDTSSYSVRSLHECDLDIFKAIRTQAIIERPDAFLDTPQNVVVKPDTQWLSYFRGSHKQIFGLFCDESLVGIGSVFQPDPLILTGHLAMGYISPEHRGRGLSSMLYKARINWARQHTDFTKLTISHRQGNDASRNAMLKFGFVHTGEENENFGDGCVAVSLRYALDLER